ncbi:MAG: rhomboid family intramembrane serine protease [Micrococcales bacterium]|nr:rhomboid family intramembrane serine protease [Micrococcales bacterium]
MTENPWNNAGAQPVEPPPVCPRHPDRVSYVRCQRCSRPVCPECQRQASVGVQCVDCVAVQAKSVRQGTTIFGGRVTDGRPVVSMAIIAICALVWLGELASKAFVAQIQYVPAFGESRPWTLLTSAFAHSPGQPMHILFNMYALWLMGQYLEPLLGRARFLALYLLTALGGSVVYTLMAQAPDIAEVHTWEDLGSWGTAMVGASGAVFGLFGALLVLNRRLGRSSAGMYLTLAVNFALGFIVPGIAWQAHVGGFLTGLAAAAAIAYAPRTSRGRLMHWGALALMLLLLVAAAWWKFSVSPGLTPS